MSASVATSALRFLDAASAPAPDLELANDADVETVAGALDGVACIALHFPKWVDGRAYSQARLLRSRYRFQGEIRATGEVVADMVPLLVRTGFDAVVLRDGENREVAERALSFFPAGHYQGDVTEPLPRFRRLGDASGGRAGDAMSADAR